jgi:Tol biopolymer transport system component
LIAILRSIILATIVAGCIGPGAPRLEGMWAESTPTATGPLTESVAKAGRGIIAQEDGLYLTDNTGGVHSLASSPTGGNVEDPSWRSDGREVAYTRLAPRPGSDAADSDYYVRFTSDIWGVSPNGTSTVLARSDSPDVMYNHPTWSPDGATLFYSREAFYRTGGIEGQTLSIERRSVASGDHSVIIADGYWPAVSPNGQVLAFVRFGPNGKADLWIHQLSSGAERRLTDGRFVNITSPRFSPDGLRLAFGGELATADIGAPLASLPSSFDGPFGFLAEPAEAHEIMAGLWLVNIGGSGLQRVGDFVVDGLNVSWTSDPNRVLLFGTNGLYDVDLNRGSRTTITEPGSHRGFDWHPSSSPPS